MSDHHHIDDEADDELVSAVLDGEATAAEVARVQADPELSRQVETFRRLADEVAGAPVPPAGLADQAIATALGHLGTSGDEATTAPPMDELAARRATRMRRFAPLLAAAAVVVLLAVAAIAFNENRSEETAAVSDATTQDNGAGDDSAESSSGTYAEADEQAAPEADMDPTAGSNEAGDAEATVFLATDDVDSFVRAVRSRLRNEQAAAPSTTTLLSEEASRAPMPQNCEPDTAGSRLDALDTPVDSGQGAIAGEPVWWGVYPSEDGQRLVILDADCRLVEEVSL